MRSMRCAGRNTRGCKATSAVSSVQAVFWMIERHWDGIVSYCKPENKVSLGCVEGLNNTIRVIQRKAYGFRDEQYLAMKIITHFLPPLPDHAKITHTNPR
jgi:transposase